MKLPKRLTKRAAKPATTTAVPASETNRVTDETLEQHRKEIFSRGRRFLYPIHTTKRHIVRRSIIISTLIVIVFLSTIMVSIYRYRSESTVIYQISKIIPFPIARVNGQFVSYEEYLFLLRSNLTYLEGSEQSKNSVDQVERTKLREDALREAKQNAVMKQLAREHSIEVSPAEVDEQIELLRSFSGGDRRLNDIVKEFYGYSLGDLRYPLYLQLLKQKLAPRLSEQAHSKAQDTLARLKSGEDFAKLAKEVSEDKSTSGNGGSLGTVDRNNTELPAEIVKAGLDLGVGEVSDIIESPQGFHIVKKLAQHDDNSAELGQILIGYNDINELLNEKLEAAHVSTYIKL